LVGCSVSDVLQALAFELGELDAVGGVADVEVEDRPDEGEAAGLAGEAADDVGAAFDLRSRLGPGPVGVPSRMEVDSEGGATAFPQGQE
jgi:hypothetical protein